MALEQVFAGSPTTLVATTGTIADGVFTVNGTNATITQFDNSTTKYPSARLTLDIPDTFIAAPTDGSTIDVYICNDDLAGGTADETAPTTTDQKGSSYLTSFRLYATDENQPKQKTISLLGISKCRMFLKNESGQTMSYTSGATLKIEGLRLADV